MVAAADAFARAKISLDKVDDSSRRRARCVHAFRTTTPRSSRAPRCRRERPQQLQRLLQRASLQRRSYVATHLREIERLRRALSAQPDRFAPLVLPDATRRGDHIKQHVMRLRLYFVGKRVIWRSRSFAADPENRTRSPQEIRAAVLCDRIGCARCTYRAHADHEPARRRRSERFRRASAST